jgi:hypothetical protein
MKKLVLVLIAFMAMTSSMFGQSYNDFNSSVMAIAEAADVPILQFTDLPIIMCVINPVTHATTELL